METTKHIRYYLILLCVTSALYTHSQIIYQFNKPVANLNYPHIYKGLSKFSTDIIGTIKNQYIYYPQFTYSTNIQITVINNNIYRGSQPNYQSLIYTIKGNYVYRKGSTTPSYTYINNKLYKSSFIHPSNIIATTSSQIPIYVLLYLLN